MSKSKQKAVALKYNVEEDAAPVVIASGYGTIAERIIDIAEQRGIPVFRDDSAASLLCMLEVGNTIPPELYEVIAAIYCQLLQISSEIKNSGSASVYEPGSVLERRSRNLESRKPSVSVRRRQAAPTPPAEAEELPATEAVLEPEQ